MCICLAEAHLSGTMLYSGSALRQGKEVHVLAYQNVAESLTNAPNAMVLPFPAAAPMNESNIIDTTHFRGFLNDISEASKRRARGFSKGMDFSVGVAAADALVFDSGSYTVVLANHAKQIPDALKKVPEHKRPEISTRFLIGFSKMYPDQPIAVCCWSGSIEPEPLLWWYEPKNPDVLFAPTMDAHDGGAPDPEAMVDTDHIISFGSTLADRVGQSNKVYYNDDIPADVRSLLPNNVYGCRLPHRMQNGDVFAHTKLGAESPSAYRGLSLGKHHSSWAMYGWS